MSTASQQNLLDQENPTNSGADHGPPVTVADPLLPNGGASRSHPMMTRAHSSLMQQQPSTSAVAKPRNTSRKRSVVQLKPSDILEMARKDVVDGKAADVESALGDRIGKFSAENARTLAKGLAKLMSSQSSGWQESVVVRDARIQQLVITSYSIHYTKLYEANTVRHFSTSASTLRHFSTSASTIRRFSTSASTIRHFSTSASTIRLV